MENDLPNLEGSGEVLKYYADLKGIPLSKVLRNAAKDCVWGAYKATPEAEKIAKLPYAYLPGHGAKKGKTVTVRIDNEIDPLEQVRLSNWRLHKPNCGFALSAFIPVFKELEFKSKKPRGNATMLKKVWSAFEKRGGDPWKKEIDAYRQSQSAGMTEKNYSHSERHEGSNPSVEISITEIALDKQHPEWQTEALEAGCKLAAETMLNDLEKLVIRPEDGYKNSGL